MQKNEVGPLPRIKSNSKWTKDLNVRVKTIKLLQENTGANLHDLESSKEFLDMRQKAGATKEKT